MKIDRLPHRAAPKKVGAEHRLPPNYAEQRSNLAKSLGLGRKPKAEEAPPAKKRPSKASAKPTASSAA